MSLDREEFQEEQDRGPRQGLCAVEWAILLLFCAAVIFILRSL